MFTSLSAAVQYVKSNNLKPFYLLTEDAKKDFGEEANANETTLNGNENSVVVGLAPDKFVYDTINTAFRLVFISSIIKLDKKKYYLFHVFP